MYSAIFAFNHLQVFMFFLLFCFVFLTPKTKVFTMLLLQISGQLAEKKFYIKLVHLHTETVIVANSYSFRSAYLKPVINDLDKV